MNSDIIEKLFKTYYNDALLYTLTISRNKAVAEDIVSTAFYKALETADDSIASFKFWLLRACRNLYYNHARKEKRRAEIPENLADEREEVLDKIIASEEYHSLYRAIDLLPAVQKEIITLFYFEDMRVQEIANLVGKSTANTKVLLFRARENLKTILEV